MNRIEHITDIAITRHKTLGLIDECIREIVEELNSMMSDKAETINLIYKCENDGRFIIEFVDRTLIITYRVIDEQLNGRNKVRKDVKNALLEVITCSMADVNIPNGV